MKNKLIGIATLSTVAVTIVLALLTYSRGEYFLAFNVQLLIVLFTLSVVLGGIYLLHSHAPKTGKKTKLSIAALGIVLTILSALVSFNALDFLSTFNWLISLGIMYILLVQLQLLQWGKSPAIFIKICSILLIFANLFLIIFFIARWGYSGIALWIDIAVLTSLVSFLVGFISLRKPVIAEESTENLSESE